jgi:O-antigen/teichoic acid export membrane protein
MAMLGRLYKALTKWILGLTLPLAMTVMVYSSAVLGIFGGDFEKGWPILIIGTIGQLINCGVGSVGLMLLMSGNQRLLLRVQIVMAAVMTFVAVLLVPVWGVIGAAIAAAITNAGTNALNLIMVRRILRLSPFSSSYLRLFVPATGAFLLALGLKLKVTFPHNWLAIGVCLVGTYAVFALLVAAVGLDDDDRLVTGALWSRFRRAGEFMKGVES